MQFGGQQNTVLRVAPSINGGTLNSKELDYDHSIPMIIAYFEHSLRITGIEESSLETLERWQVADTLS